MANLPTFRAKGWEKLTPSAPVPCGACGETTPHYYKRGWHGRRLCFSCYTRSLFANHEAGSGG